MMKRSAFSCQRLAQRQKVKHGEHLLAFSTGEKYFFGVLYPRKDVHRRSLWQFGQVQGAETAPLRGKNRNLLRISTRKTRESEAK
jgi:hypothetical protein